MLLLMLRLHALLFSIALAASAPLAAEPLAREDVPAPLAPWVDWVLRGHEAERCPFLHASGERFCVWPGRLELELDAAGGRFGQELYVAMESEVPVPGGGEHWPEHVRADGAAAPVFERGGRPALRLARGAHRVSGRFLWSALPPLLGSPPETGVVVLRVEGAAVPFPKRDAEGRLWLRESDASPAPRVAEDHLEVDVQRRVVDEIPLRLDTHITLRVAGAARDELLGRALPDGFVPVSLRGPLPARLEPDGRLRVQLRPGNWALELVARHQGQVNELALPAQPDGAPWDASEVWSVETRPELRLIEIEGAASVDPSQTELPDEWRALPAFRVEPGGGLRLVEKRRGDEAGGADRLSLKRTWHLDFDGGGATVADRIEGELRVATRLEMGDATTLGRAAVNGADQPVTRRTGVTQLGVEVPLGPLAVEADSRVEGGARRLPAVGWDHDFDALAATLQLPPGWRLLHASGVDRATPTWIASWTLLDLFVVMVVAMAALRLFGLAAGALALVTLALTYTEAGAPQWVWLAVLAAEALRRVVPEGRLASAVRAFRLASLAALVVLAIPFAVSQLRAGLFPALERPWQAAVARGVEGKAAQAPEPGVLAEPAAMESASGHVMASKAPATYAKRRSLGYLDYAPDPDAKIQTGPGRPDWTWQLVTLHWSGPAPRGQELVLWLLPPWLSGALAILRVALLAALVLLVFGRLAGLARLGRGGAPPIIGSTLAALVALAATQARAELPTPELLGELRERLLEVPSCHPSCATASRLALEVSPNRLELRLSVDVAAESAIPLPGAGEGAGFQPDVIAIDGVAADAVRRDASGQLWLRLAEGNHTLLLAGALPALANVEIPLPLRPQRAELTSPPRGWTLLGVLPDGRVSGALQLVRDAAAESSAAEAAASLEPTAIPPFVSVERTLLLGLSWQATTQVLRIAPPDGAVLIEVPLLPGESVTTPGVQVADGRALVTLAPGAAATGWISILAPGASLSLAAPRDVAWTEVWRLDPSPLWHVTPQGIPAVDAPAAGRRLRAWRPGPGEKLSLAVEKPEGAGGDTLTIDRSELGMRPGLRATDARLALALRSSQGGQHFVTLPEGAELTELTLDGVVQPLRQEGRRVPIALAPGAHAVGLAWREPRGISAWFEGPAVDLGLASVNAHVEITPAEGRWLLFVGGPRLGPTLLFWPILCVVAGLAIALGRVAWTPLRTRHWLLLGVGLTQAPLPAAALVAVWLLALGWRGRLSEQERTRSPAAFDLLQIVLAALTLAALVALLIAIQMGLLGTPSMQVAGNASEYGVLRWYQDRATALLPQPWLLSLSLWFYRLVMLAWSLWVAQALVGWLRWGWRQWSAGGHWLRLRGARTPNQA